MSGETILVIDDSTEMVKHLTEYILPTFGYETLHAFDGQNGLNLIREAKPDLVMLDYNLPRMTGIDVLQKMAEESLSPPVILMTGYGSELSAIEAFRLGAKDYLIKPFTVDEVVETISRSLVETRLIHDKEELMVQLRQTKQEMNRQTQQMTELFRVGKAITSLLNVDVVLNRVLETASTLTEAEESNIWLPDANGEQMSAYEKLNAAGEAITFPSLSINDSHAGHVLQSGKPYRDANFDGDGIKLATGYLARSVLFVPLKLRGMVMGVLGVANWKATRPFTQEDEFLLSFLADYAAIALENARVFQASDKALAIKVKELNALIKITQMITAALDLDEIVEKVVKYACDYWQIEAVSIWLLNKEKQVLSAISDVGTAVTGLTQYEIPVGTGVVGHVVQTKKEQYENNLANNPIHYKQIDQALGFVTHNILSTPLICRGDVIGAIQFLNKKEGAFDEQDVEQAVKLAAPIAIAISNTLLIETSQSNYKND